MMVVIVRERLSQATRAALAKSCEINAKDTAELIGTGYVVRDIIEIVDTVNKGSLLNY